MMSEKTRKLVYGAMFVAIAVILGSFFSFYLTESSKVSLAPAAVMLAGAVLGPVWGMAAGAVTDFVSYLVGGKAIAAYFPGFTLTMALYGLLAALFFYRKRNTVPGIIGGTVLIQAVCSLLLNTLWNFYLFGTSFGVLLAMRAPAAVVACAIYAVILCVMLKNREKFFRGIDFSREGSGNT